VRRARWHTGSEQGGLAYGWWQRTAMGAWVRVHGSAARFEAWFDRSVRPLLAPAHAVYGLVYKACLVVAARLSALTFARNRGKPRPICV